MSDERGLFDKFNVIRRDGRSAPGEAHESCSYFVLDLDHDRFSWPALDAYATYCEEERPVLAADLRRMVDPNLVALGVKPIAEELSRLVAADAEVARLQDALAQKDEEITALEGQIKSDAVIMAENDAMIAALGAKLEAAQAALDKIREGFERGFFTRDATFDVDPAWAIKLFPYIRALAHDAGEGKP